MVDVPGASLDSASEIQIDGLSMDSRNVSSNYLFCCVIGQVTDGHDFAQDAINNGAAALLTERDLNLSVPSIVVPDVRAAIGPIAATFFGHPDRDMILVGVTGTNGKTTTTHILASILIAHGWKTEILGTLSGNRTTPEAIDLIRQLAQWRDGDVKAVVMEVSSHALDQHRIDGCTFEVVVFTNLSQDHLDYHNTMDAYFQAKKRLFAPYYAKKGIVNSDDSYGKEILSKPEIPLVPFSINGVSDLNYGDDSTRFIWNGSQISIGLLAEHNVYNAVAAATVAQELDIPVQKIVEGLAKIKNVPGRFESVRQGQSFRVFVDYAHTPDGLLNALRAARRYVGDDGRLFVVFGCGGDRDRTKRPEMGKIASENADIVVITSDNPRSENPDEIIKQIVEGISDRSSVSVEPDRLSAIHQVLSQARKDDVVLIAGKGHETTQVIGDRIIPFDDRDEARKVLRELLESPV